MKKLILLSPFVLLMACTSESDMPSQNPSDQPNNGQSRYYIAPEKALELAEQGFSILPNEGNTRSANRIVQSVKTYGKQATRSSEENAYQGYYIINYQNNSGYAVMSADSRKVPILAMSDEGSLAIEDTVENKGLALFFNMLEKNGEQLTGINFPGGGTQIPIDPPYNPNDSTTLTPTYPYILPEGVIEHSYKYVDSYVREWHQWDPFNKYVVEKYGEGVPVGCVALSMVQVMTYHEWPKNYEDYNFMLSSMKSDSQLAYERAAKLLEYVGRPEHLNLNYKKGSTSGSMYDAALVLKKFGYSNSGTRSFTHEGVQDNLKNYGPIMVAGSYNIAKGAHAWVCDGYHIIEYSADEIAPGMKVNFTYYHMVWGEKPCKNGFYAWDPSIILYIKDKDDNYLYDYGLKNMYYLDKIKPIK